MGGSPAQVRSIREGLLTSGILSYCKYEGSVCTVMNELVAILDFSEYYLLGFRENCLDGLKDAIFGNWSVSFDNVTVPVYDSVTGAALAPVTASFSQGGYVIGGTRSSSLTTSPALSSCVFCSASVSSSGRVTSPVFS